MSASALLDHTREPRARELPAVLGRSHALWERLLAEIDAAPKHVEGRGFGLEARFRRDLAAIETLAAIKTAN